MSEVTLAAIVAIARLGAERVSALYAEHQAAGIEVFQKGPNDPVTRADREANAIIVRALAERFPEAAVIAEESVPTPEQHRLLLEKERVFYVDPLDGTREFIDGRPEFAVMVGLAERGRAVAGAVVIPADGSTLAGAADGAWIETRDGTRTPLTVSDCGEFPQARLIASRSHRPPIIAPLCKRLGVQSIVPCGSVGVKIARLAQRAADLYVHAGRGLKLWDTCAPDPILYGAGGRMSYLDGRPIDYAAADLHLRRGLVASNGTLHPGILSAVGWAERAAADTEA